MKKSTSAEIANNLPFTVDEAVLEKVSEFLQDHASSEMGPPDTPAPQVVAPP